MLAFARGLVGVAGLEPATSPEFSWFKPVTAATGASWGRQQDTDHALLLESDKLPINGLGYLGPDGFRLGQWCREDLAGP